MIRDDQTIVVGLGKQLTPIGAPGMTDGVGRRDPAITPGDPPVPVEFPYYYIKFYELE